MQKRISLLLLFLVIVIVFRKFFLPGPLVFGDAPFFYKEGLKELVALPSTWTARGNSLGGVNLFLWIYPIMVMYGFLGTFFHLGNDLILRILFYFPSLIFGVTGIYFLTKYFKLSSIVQFFASLIYLVNTYYLLIITGGQVGVVLAYGLFPLVLLFLLKVIDKFTVWNFLTAVLISFGLTVVDFRISLICIITAFLLKLFDWKKLTPLILVSVCLLGLSAYWVIPSLNLAQNSIGVGISSLNTTSLLNSLTLFSPNWPANEFGKVVAPFFYFIVLPLSIFVPLFVRKDRKTIWLTFIFLIFAYLAKGTSDPLGGPYKLLLSTQIGVIFRDSTKFFIPLVLVAGILIGTSIEEISKFIKANWFKNLTLIVSFLVILFLVWPAVFGKLNGVLGKTPDLSDYQRIYNLVKAQKGFLRDAWFVEKSPFAFHTDEKQALDAKDLVNFRPLASMNGGTGDRFNFINNPSYLDWFDLFGIKYLVFNGNPRVQTLNESDQKDWNRLLDLVEGDKRLKKVDVNTSFPVYETPQVHPHSFYVPNALLVVGSDDIYQKLKSLDNNFSVGNQAILFAEDGKFDPSVMQYNASTSATIVFNGKAKDDLKMSFLQSNFVSPTKSVKSDWAVRTPADYLMWKFELTEHGIFTHEFDYNQGVAFSSVKNEKIIFDLNAPEDGNYFLEIRSMMASGSGDLNIDFNGQKYLVERKTGGSFEWFEKGPILLTKGSYRLSLENTGGVQVVNSAALVNRTDVETANDLTKRLLGLYQHLDVDNPKDKIALQRILTNDKWEQLQDGQATKNGWIIYTDTFNPKWAITKINGDSFPSYPAYSAINGFYYDPSMGNIKIVFNGIEDLRWGIYYFVLSVLSIAIVVLWKLKRSK